MKKFLLIVFLLSILTSFVNASQWFEIFENQFIDMDSIITHGKQNEIKFWVKSKPKNKSDNFLDQEYAYVLSLWNLSCKNKKSRIESVFIYDKNLKILYSDNEIPNWEIILPDTYAYGYYRLFCLLPFSKNPLLKNN